MSEWKERRERRIVLVTSQWDASAGCLVLSLIESLCTGLYRNPLIARVCSLYLRETIDNENERGSFATLIPIDLFSLILVILMVNPVNQGNHFLYTDGTFHWRTRTIHLPFVISLYLYLLFTQGRDKERDNGRWIWWFLYVKVPSRESEVRKGKVPSIKDREPTGTLIRLTVDSSNAKRVVNLISVPALFMSLIGTIPVSSFKETQRHPSLKLGQPHVWLYYGDPSNRLFLSLRSLQ